jgi:hypothetical protein
LCSNAGFGHRFFPHGRDARAVFLDVVQANYDYHNKQEHFFHVNDPLADRITVQAGYSL